ncbi:MAG: hypothetical protein GYA50_08265 [Eubacteriaceae bacterium]|nr:hypothetical protein [Eubacteriaceae bacterium]
MPISFTDKYNVNKKLFAQTGAFDVILDIDSRLFIEPKLFEECNIKEFIGAKEKVQNYFSNIISLLTHSKKQKDMFWKAADKLLTFTEFTGTCFGYTQYGTDGNAIGVNLRNEILTNVKEIIVAGEKDPVIFELLGVFQTNIGCDRISDLLTFILMSNILEYTERVINSFGLSNTIISYKGTKYKSVINDYNNKPIMLLPTCLLNPLPIANCFNEIENICTKNQEMRDKMNALFNFGDRRKKLSKEEINFLMKFNSEFRNAIIKAYKEFNIRPYDFDVDPVGEYIWYITAKEYVTKFPIQLALPFEVSINEIFNLVEQICMHFKKLIEVNGLCKLLYDDDLKPKHEGAAQLLFFGICDGYCIANNIDISRESNNGRGPVDFKFSKGYQDKVIVEVKLTSNPQLKHALEIQIPIYMQQENIKKAIYLIIENGHQKALDNFIKFYKEQSKEVKDKIAVIIIDGKPQKSASKA